MSSTGRGSRRKRSRKSTPAGFWTSPAWIAGAAIVLILALWWALQSQGPESLRGDSIEDRLRSLAETHGVAAGDLEVDQQIRKVDGVFVRTWEVRFPSTAAREEFIASVVILADEEAVSVGEPEAEVGRVVGLRIDHGVEAFDLRLRVARTARVVSGTTAPVPPTPTERPPTPTPRPAPPPGSTGKLAILLDDAGQKLDLVPAAERLPNEIGVAVLPFLPYSTESAVAFHEAGHEVWLHLPMEAVGDNDPGPGALMTSMSDAELGDAVFMAINNIPNLVGVNNHMGSLATADLRMMTWVMQDLAAMDLAFIDSRTTVETVAEEAARAQGVKTGRRHVFLDNERTPAAIRTQLDEAVYRALTEGQIIAIGHLNEVTIGVLTDELPALKSRGVTLVRPTALLN
jgi:polysaccharide deacetylase 2 family uncharacterized protein YibQ